MKSPGAVSDVNEAIAYGMILDHGGVVWVTLSGQEDSCNLFESCAVDSDQAQRIQEPVSAFPQALCGSVKKNG